MTCPVSWYVETPEGLHLSAAVIIAGIYGFLVTARRLLVIGMDCIIVCLVGKCTELYSG